MSIVLLGNNIGTLQIINGIVKRDTTECTSLESTDLTGFESSVC